MPLLQLFEQHAKWPGCGICSKCKKKCSTGCICYTELHHYVTRRKHPTKIWRWTTNNDRQFLSKLLLLQARKLLLEQVTLLAANKLLEPANLVDWWKTTCKVQTLHGLLIRATWHMHMCGTGAIQLYIELAPCSALQTTFRVGVWSCYRS